MKNLFNRIISLICAVTLLICVLSVCAAAENEPASFTDLQEDNLSEEQPKANPENDQDETGKVQGTENENDDHSFENETQNSIEMPSNSQMLQMGYYKVQVARREGAIIYSSANENAVTDEKLESGMEIWVKPTIDPEFASVFNVEKDAPVQYIKWNDVVILIQNKTESDAEENSDEKADEVIETVPDTDMETEPEQSDVIEQDEDELMPGMIEEKNEENHDEDEEEKQDLPDNVRAIEIYSTRDEMKSIPEGTRIDMKVIKQGFMDTDICEYQWYYSSDAGEHWNPIESATEETYSYTITSSNWYYRWRVVINIQED